MKIRQTRKYFSKALLPILLISSVVGCGSINANPRDHGHSKGYSQDYLPVAIRFKMDGTPVVVGAKGQPVDLIPIRFPLATEKLYRLDPVAFGIINNPGDCKWVFISGTETSYLQLQPQICSILCREGKSSNPSLICE